MKLNAYMTAFTGRDGEPVTIRAIDIPGEEIPSRVGDWTVADIEAILERAFHWGQNDFQPRRAPSLSPGDVVEIGHPIAGDEDVTYWRVEGIGFKQVNKPESPAGFSAIITS